MMADTMPGSAAGKTTRLMVSDFVAPMAYDPSRKDCGTALMMSSESDEISGTIIMPMTRPAASADSDDTSRPSDSPVFLTNGATVRAAKNPSTTVGMPASISSMGLAMPRTRGEAYSAM